MSEATLVLFVGEFIGCVVFCILFGLKWRNWIRTRMGPNLFAVMFVLAVLQGIAVLRLILPLEWIEENAVIVRFWSFLALFLVVWHRNYILIRVQHDDREEIKKVAAAARVEEARRLAAKVDDDTDPGLEKASVD